MSETVTFKLNGNDVTVPKGWTVMQAAKKHGVHIPHFCWHPGLPVAGVCRFCMVKVAGRPKHEIACNLTATDGLDVSTTDGDVKDAHKWALEYHLVNHPLDCPVCDQAGECELQNLYMEDGKYESQMTRPKVLKPKALDVGSELILDTERCILCSRCVRFEEEVTKTGALGIFDRGDRAIIGTYQNQKIEHNYQGNLVDICPVGAFTSKDFRFQQRVWFLEEKPTTCPGCATGCQINVHYKEQTRQYFRVKPLQSEVNGHWMCDKGRKSYKHLNRSVRLSGAWYRDAASGKRKKGSFVEGVTALAAQIKAAGPQNISLLVSPQYTNEEFEAFFSYFIDTLGVKNVFPWREPTEDRAAFDGILLRGDRNANSAGLSAALVKRGIKLSDKDDSGAVAGGSAKLIIALAPEIDDGYPSLAKQLDSLEKHGNVSVWTSHLAIGNRTGFANVLPMMTFTEKSGTFTNHAGHMGALGKPVAGNINEARDLTQAVSLLAGINSAK